MRTIGAQCLNGALGGILVFATASGSWAQANEASSHPNYAIPIVDIVGFDFLVNRIGERFVDVDTFRVTAASIRRNVTHGWVVDHDPFSTNQLLHPYQGAMYHGFARSAGLNYWQSAGYSFVGSALWEIAAETTRSSINDQIATGMGGPFLGEPLFRMANLVLEKSSVPRFWRECLVLVTSPSTEFNRAAYGDRFRQAFPSRSPAVYSRVQLGTMGTSTAERKEAMAEFAIDYGLPGKAGYEYTRPFDYFSFEFAGSSVTAFEHIFSRGLLAGKAYGTTSERHSGVWGLYGTYDYWSPQLFRMSSIAINLGNTSEWRLTKSIALQSTVLGGVGYGAAGTTRGTNETDYHYGITPQALVTTRVIAGSRAALDLTARDYYVSRVASTTHRGTENDARVEGMFTLRVWHHNGASVKYLWSRRAATSKSFGVFYTFSN